MNELQRYLKDEFLDSDYQGWSLGATSNQDEVGGGGLAGDTTSLVDTPATRTRRPQLRPLDLWRLLRFESR